MEAVFQHADDSSLNFNVPKRQSLLKVWKSLWEQCEEANERLNNVKACFPKPNKSMKVSNIMKMLVVFQAEVKDRNLNSDNDTLGEDFCENCGTSKSKQRQLEEDYNRRGDIIETLLSQRKAPNLANTGQAIKSSAAIETFSSPENTTGTLVHLLPNFSKHDPSKDPFTNMSVFENECNQHNLGPRESCLMMKLWLPSQMSARLTAPIARPAGGLQFWSNNYHWGDDSDRLKSLTYLTTGEDNLGIDILEDLKVTPQDDPWAFAQKFEKAYRLVVDVQDSKPPPALLKSLVNKFSFLDSATHAEASKEKTVDGIVRLVERYQRDNGLKASLAWQNNDACSRRVHNQTLIPENEQPRRWRRQSPSFHYQMPENIEEQRAVDSPLNSENTVDTTTITHGAFTQSHKP